MFESFASSAKFFALFAILKKESIANFNKKYCLKFVPYSSCPLWFFVPFVFQNSCYTKDHKAHKEITILIAISHHANKAKVYAVVGVVFYAVVGVAL